MKSIIKNSKHFEPVRGIKGCEEMEGLRTFPLPISYIPLLGSSLPLSWPLIALSWCYIYYTKLLVQIYPLCKSHCKTMLKQLSKYTTYKILHQVVGANIFSVQIASKIFSVQIVLQNDAEAAAGLNHPPPQSKAAASRPRHN